MRSPIRAAALAAACAMSFAATAAEPLVRFEGGIGVQPLRAGPAVNTVFDVNPGGIPWVISSLSADVSSDGKVNIDGRGLLLAGGNGIGTPGGQRVRARLYCAGVPHNTDVDNPVPLEPNGDFRINGFLTPTPPSVCNNPVLLILNAGGAWFAAGILKQ
jgi:hypothetical protein